MSEIDDLIHDFFALHGGQVEEIRTLRRANHQHPSPPGDGMLTCTSARIRMNDSAILGTGGPFLTEVFPRYRSLSHGLAGFLTERGVVVNSPRSTLAVHVLPYPAQDACPRRALPRRTRPSRGAHAPSVTDLARRSAYYRRLADRYRVEHCVVTNNGTVVGPDGGILGSACAVAELFERPIRVAELGTGAGTTATALLAREKLASYCGNDFSPEMAAFFRSSVQPKLERAGVDVSFTFGPCEDLDLAHRVDLFVLGVYYEAQPDLVAARGEAIAAKLRGGGVLAAQSGKPENPFVTELLRDPDGPHRRWPWYDPATCLVSYFPYVTECTVEDETMLIACDDRGVLGELAEVLDSIAQQNRGAD